MKLSALFWRPKHPIAFLASILIFGLILLFAYLYLISQAFQLDLQARFIQYLEKATGSVVQLAGFHMNPILGSLELTGLKIARADMPDKPFLEVENALVAFSLLSPLEERVLSLRSVTLQKPQVRLEYLENRSTLPRAAGAGQDSVNFVENLFRIAIDHLAVDDGALYLKTNNIPLQLDLKSIRLNLLLDQNSFHYAGSLEFQDGSLAIRSWRAAHLALKTRLRFYSQGVELSEGHLSMPSSQIRFSGLVANLYSPDLWLDISAQGEAEEFQETFGRDLGIRGSFQSIGRLTFNAGRFKMLGRITSPETTYWRMTPRNLQADFSLDTNGISLNSTTFDLLEGHGRGELLMQWGGGDFAGSGNFKITNLDARIGLAEILKLDLPVAAAVDGLVSLDWSTARSSFTANAESSLRSSTPFEGAGLTAASALPLRGKVSLRYADGRFLFNSAELESPGGAMSASGWIALDQHAALEMSYHGESLETSIRQLALFLKTKPGAIDSWLEAVHSEATEFIGRFEGMNSPNPIQGRLILHRPAWRNVHLDSAQADMTWNQDRIDLTPYKIQVGEALMSGSLAVLLSEASGTRGTIELNGTLDQLSLLSVLQAIGWEVPVRGVAGGSISLRGLYPQLDGAANLRIDQPSLLGQSFEQVRASLTLNNGLLRIERLDGQLASRQVSAEGWCDLAKRTYSIRASGKGWNVKSLLESGFEGGPSVAGLFEFAAQGEGSLDSPTIAGTIIAQQIQVDTLTLEQAQAKFNFASRQLHVTASTGLGGGKIELRGTGNWTESKPTLTAALAVESIDPLHLQVAPVSDETSHLTALLSGSVSLSGPLMQPDQWKAKMRFPSAKLKLGDIEFINQAPFESRYQDRKLILDPIEFSGNRNRFNLSGEITVAPKIAMNLRITSQLNLDLFNAMTRGVILDGTAAFSVNLQGDPADPRIFGTCRISNAAASLKDANYSFSNINGLVFFNEHLAGISDLKGTLSGGGRVALNGSVNLDRLTVKDFVLQAKLEQVLLRIPQGFRTESNADLVLRGDMKSQVLVGQVDVETAVYSRNVDFLTQITAMAGDAGARKAESSALDNLSLNLEVNFQNGILIKTQTVRLSADSRLHILGPAARPSLLGRISASSGEVFFMGNRYEITKGGVEFVNPVRIEPQFDLEAKTSVKGYRINLLLRGTPENIQPEFRSEPPLPVLDLITLLSTGATSGELMGESPKGSGSLGMAASNILAGGLAQQVENRVQRVLGFSQFKIDPLISTRSSNPTARVTVERRLNNNLSVTYSTDITTSKTQIVVLEYYLTPDYSLVASRDENGRYGLDLRIQRKF
jgi:translocation and assembly module TamB